jgi:outer membrane protein assembly factor BamB
MNIDQIDLPTSQKPLRVWPGVVAVAALWLARYGVPGVAPDLVMYSIMVGGPFGVLTFVVWWAFFSRAPRFERLGALVLMIVALVATSRLLHNSIATALFFFDAICVLCLAFVAWAVACRRLAVGPRRAAMVATILLTCGAWTLVRTDGVTGNGFTIGASQFAWRWSATPEERLLAKADEQLTALPPAPAVTETPKEQVAAKAGDKPAALSPAPAAAEAPADWPGFRGPNRNGVITGVRIKTDWSASPPVELWRRPVGPGWSSFAVRGALFYTQEQRGNDEVVACYNVTTGKPVWRHRDAVRFWESNAGAGPRATPTLSNGRVYTFGATGILNALDPRTGAVVWSRNAASDTDVKVPIWGFASSPLVVDDVVIVATAGKLVAYDVATGKPRWFGPEGGSGYSSPHPVTIGGVAQILLLNGAGAISVAPADGKLLWKHEWNIDGIVQPFVIAGSDVLIGSGSGLAEVGMRRVAVGRGPGGWSVEERWTSNGLKPYYNDFVVHNGHAFGFDGSILACIDLKDGKRKWKGGRYGHGQLVLLPDQDLLLALSEEGALALVGATPGQFTELARFPAMEGKTWNHPALVSDLLLVRNGEEMVAFRLPLAGR